MVTTDSDHDGPIFPDLAKDVVPDRPNQVWVADLHSALGYLSPMQFEDQHALQTVKSAA